MSVKVDIPKSEQARADGNAAFKKGKWVDAIGHYTTAVVYNPDDPIAYSNRAQAFLKLDKYNDAERDCTTALSLPKGKGNVKALYRRGLARKGLDKIDEAILDMEEVIKVEKTNEGVKKELEELTEMKKKKEAKIPRRPITPPSVVTKPPTPASAPVPTSAATSAAAPSAGHAQSAQSAQSEKGTKPPQRDTTSLTNLTNQTQKLDLDIALNRQPDGTSATKDAPSSAASSSFASLRKSRDGKRKAFVGNSTIPNSDNNVSAQDAPSSSSAPTLTNTTAVASSRTELASVKAGPKPTTSASSTQPSSDPTLSLPPLPTTLDTSSTSPGSVLLLLRHLHPTSPSYNFDLLSLYPPGNISKILDNLLEPDTLGLILLALEHGAQIGSTQLVEEDEGMRIARIKEIMLGLKGTKRWSMNVAMLSKREKEAGQKAWTSSGGQGNWIS
ncbi:hypothetical protein CI109_107313 [Kwoniella shandongensis]|uniref:RNA polymerase II-associated protein 3 n=1 Tax=Kwoniella shandongensis TaxID=1734106 RepID=A0A5M6BYL9_9TREE|nr:uncharacterized protein CI109_004759 [Kwoniella shandongensis]KAA5526982.1 hypothetical protein CI109_004759 [Kwoniella shandongensis]